MPSTMPTNIYNFPTDPEPLPLYRRDPETSSILSSAPSYTSEAPTYHSRRQSQRISSSTDLHISSQTPIISSSSSSSSNTPLRQQEQRQRRQPTQQQHQQQSPRRRRQSPQEPTPYGLPFVAYAPGFTPRQHVHSSLPTYPNLSPYSSPSTSNASRQLHAVAHRRASQAAANASTHTLGILTSMSPVVGAVTMSSIPSSSVSNNTTITTSSSSSRGTQTTPASLPLSTTPPPISPHEDPTLVGEEAAARTRQARIYREKCAHDDAALQHESQAWCFMLGQMADWEERERSWTGFRDQVTAKSRRAGGGKRRMGESVLGRWKLF